MFASVYVLDVNIDSNLLCANLGANRGSTKTVCHSHVTKSRKQRSARVTSSSSESPNRFLGRRGRVGGKKGREGSPYFQGKTLEMKGF